MFRFPLTKKPQTSREPFSVETLAKNSRLRGANVTQGICPTAPSAAGS
jgi:formate dehydrogenase major subunit